MTLRKKLFMVGQSLALGGPRWQTMTKYFRSSIPIDAPTQEFHSRLTEMNIDVSNLFCRVRDDTDLKSAPRPQAKTFGVPSPVARCGGEPGARSYRDADVSHRALKVPDEYYS